MKPYFFVSLLLMLTYCNAPTAASNPLETFDRDRLWVLLSAIEVSGGLRATNSSCSYFYRDAPMLGGGYVVGDPTEYCTKFTDELATYLAHNGVSGVKPVHLQTTAFWASLLAMSFAIEDCQERLGLWPRFPREPRPKDYDTRKEFGKAEEEHRKQRSKLIDKHRQAREACNPYIRALQSRDDAIEACRERLGGTYNSPPAHEIPREPMQIDYDTYEEYGAAMTEYGKQRREQAWEHRRAWDACAPHSGTRPTLQDDRKWLGISLPPGLGLLV